MRGETSNERTKQVAARRRRAIARAIAGFEKFGERQKKLVRLYAKQRGKCHICGAKAILDGKGGQAGCKESAVTFRLGSSFGKKGRQRFRVMVHRKCAQARSDEIQDSIPVEERWLRSGRAPSEFYSHGNSSSLAPTPDCCDEAR